MTISLLTAGGIGQRSGQDVPKQFLHIENKPVIIYTLEAFQKHPSVDTIIVSCLEGWQNVLWAYAKQYNITKLQWIVNEWRSSLPVLIYGNPRKSWKRSICRRLTRCNQEYL